jgi:F-type H+-transporting ATPase subunit b
VIELDLGIVFGSAPDGRLFGLDMQTVVQIVAHLINVSILAFILAKLLYKPVREFLHKRSDRIREQLEQAGGEMARGKELRLLYEQKMKDIELERDEILDEARKLAAETGRQIVADAKKEADAVRERATANVDMEWERAEAAMRQAIIDVSAAMTEKFVTLAINKETHDRLFDETMAELEGMTWRN